LSAQGDLEDDFELHEGKMKVSKPAQKKDAKKKKQDDKENQQPAKSG